MATCLDITLKEIAENLSIEKMIEAKSIAGRLNFMDCQSPGYWNGSAGNKRREEYSSLQKKWADIMQELRDKA